jgi:site-specific recombinase XerD
VLRHLSINTEKAYTHWLRRYGVSLKDPKLHRLSAERKIETFLTTLALSGASASTQNQAFNALLFFYRDVLKHELGEVNALLAKRPMMVRQCTCQDEVSQVLDCVGDMYGYPTRFIVHLLYGCGLRVSEPLNLRIKDVDLRQNRLYLHHAKGSNGRVVPLPSCLAAPLQSQLLVARRRAEHYRD